MYRNTVLPEYVFKAYVGDYVDLKKMREVFERASVESTFADFLAERREAEYRKLLETVRKNSVDVEVEVAKAVSRTLTLKTPKIEVTKIVEKKPDANEIVHVALQGMSGEVLRRLVDVAVSCR